MIKHSKSNTYTMPILLLFSLSNLNYSRICSSTRSNHCNLRMRFCAHSGINWPSSLVAARLWRDPSGSWRASTVKKFTGGSSEFLKQKVAHSPGLLTLIASDTVSAVVVHAYEARSNPTESVGCTTNPQSLLVLVMKTARSTFSVGLSGIRTNLS
jgi:hypothetical protein